MRWQSDCLIKVRHGKAHLRRGACLSHEITKSEQRRWGSTDTCTQASALCEYPLYRAPVYSVHTTYMQSTQVGVKHWVHRQSGTEETIQDGHPGVGSCQACQVWPGLALQVQNVSIPVQTPSRPRATRQQAIRAQCKPNKFIILVISLLWKPLRAKL